MLVHLRPTENVHAQARPLLPVLERFGNSKSSVEAVIDDVGNDFILVEEVALRGAQMVRTRFCLSNFLEEVRKF